VFLSDFRGYKSVLFHRSKITNLELCVLSILLLLSLVSGYLFKDLFAGLGSPYFNNLLVLQRNCYDNLTEVEFLSWQVKVLPCLFSVVAFQIESRFYECKWYINEVFNCYFVLPNLFLGRFFYEQYEKRALELNGPLFLYNCFQKIR